ncbi:polysaccharide deacetylase family protein [Arthrobacter crusticola]|uniref:polysaccharide deacetylase family protein n=1 Tax=Arthrobacter crusticola TaxID=2547960 RepID=UPI0014048738|nr:polysaccharide deacetylase family protein [Arthrobacter crusticola]
MVLAAAGGQFHAAKARAQAYPFVPNQALVDAFLARRGGPIGTGGKPAVSFRCDHHLNKFQSLLLPLHRKYDIPVTLAFGSKSLQREVGADGSHLLTFPGIQKLALENGFEIGNHGATHRDAATSTELRAEIVHSKWDLEEAMPKLPVEMFVPPGVGGTRYGGFDGGRIQSDYQRYLAGRVIIANHAVSTGYIPGAWPMNGDPMSAVGAVHINIENAPYANRGPDFVRAAAQSGRGVNFMYHPNLIDPIDLHAIEGFFAWCAAERRVGRLEVLSSTGMMAAKFGSAQRHNMLSSTASFSGGWNGWNGSTANWALLTEGGTRYARRGSGSTSLSKDVNVGSYAGSTRQLRIPLRSTTGASVRIEILDAASPSRLLITRDATLPKSANFADINHYLTLPLRDTARLRVRITPRSGGEIHLHEPKLLAA